VTWPSGGSGYGDSQAGGPDSSGPQGVPGYQQQQQPYGQQQQQQPPQYPGYNYGQPQYPGQQQQQPQYPQQQPYQSNYGGFGMYQQPPQGPPPRNRRTLTIVLTLVGVLVLAGVVTTVVLLTRNGQPQAGERTQTSTPPTTSAGLKPLDPRVPGWQVAVSNRRNVAYDVPKTQWTKDDPDEIAGMGPSDGDFVTGTGAAYYMKGYCAGQAGSVRAGTAVTANDTEGPEQSAPDTAKHWATVAYKSDSGQAPDVKSEPAKQIKISDGKVTATLSVADVTTPKSTNTCTPPNAKVYAAAVKTSDTGSVILVLFADQGVPNALTDADAMKIMTSMRPSG
jgi:hypothetical protein